MANPNKVKGDRVERDVRKIISQYDRTARRTRPGRREDEGDSSQEEFRGYIERVEAKNAR